MLSFGLVRPDDIEMILQAYCDNQKQYFKLEINKNINSSKAIKQNKDNVYLDRINKKFVTYDIESETITSIGDVYEYQTYLQDNYGINIDMSDLEQVYEKNKKRIFFIVSFSLVLIFTLSIVVHLTTVKKTSKMDYLSKSEVFIF